MYWFSRCYGSLRMIFGIVPVMMLFVIGCAGIPKMATVTDHGRNVDLVVTESDKTENFLVIKQVKLSDDKKQLLIIPVQGDNILLDSNGVTEMYKMKPGLDSKVEPYFEWTGFQQHDNQTVSVDNKYSAELNWFMGTWQSITIKEIATGREETFGAGVTRGVGPYYFGRNDRLYIHFISGTNDLELYDLKTFKMLSTVSIAYTGGTIDGFNSMSSDSHNDILVLHSSRLIQFFRFSTGESLGNLLLLNNKDWVVVTLDGRYDGTPNAVSLLSWQIGEEKIKLTDFGSNFFTKGLLGEILGISKAVRRSESPISLAGQLIGKVRQVNGKEIVVASGRAADTMKAGDRLFMMVDGKKIILEVVFPMMASAKCRVADGSTVNPPIGSPVFK